jgi:hypothetical protein
MCIALGFIAIVLPISAMNLDSLEGNWSVSVRLDNMFRVETRFHESVWTGSFEDDLGGVYFGSEHSASFGFPTEYSILWRTRRDLALGLEGSLDYRKEPKGTYERERADFRERRDTDGSSWTGSLSLGIYRYFTRDKFISPFVAFVPFLTESHYRMSDDVSYSLDSGDSTWTQQYSIERDTRRYGAGLHLGAEVFFKLSSAKMGLRMKSRVLRFWRESYERTVTRSEDGNARIDTVREDTPFGVDFDLPTKGNFSLWLSFYF